MIKNDLVVNQLYSGFRLLQHRYIKEIDTNCYEFLHEKSGAKLAFLDNNDDNKVFSISFRTTPKDDTGVAHIVEHSVLCGSRKFPSKEPFVELVKGSLNTFLNAMTFPDKTMYPIASKNDKDFRNLMDVYLDAVFYPNMVNDPKVLQQEGWHYEINSPDQPLTYSGVVYNEMKGALAAPDSILDRKAMNYLYPDTTYQYESGGDPEFITDLTQEDFLNFHKQYYHPSNSYIFLYGNLDILDNLQFINEEYLKDFDKINIESKVGIQKSFASRKYFIDKYPITKGESKEKKTFLSLNYSICSSLDYEATTAFGILENALLDAEGAPLRLALIEANIAEDVNSSFENGIYQPYLSINLIGSDISQKNKFESIVDEKLLEISKNGLNKNLLRAAINSLEFSLREGDTGSTPKGLLMNIAMMSSWLYDGDPFVYLAFEDILTNLKEKAEGTYFEELIVKYLLNNKHSHLLVLQPDDNLTSEKEKAVTNKLLDIKKKFSDKDIQNIIVSTKELKDKQQSVDTPEVLEKIPLLKLSDIEAKAHAYPIKIEQLEDVTHYYYNADTNGIAYISLFFNASSVLDDDYMYAILLSEVLGKVDTENYSYGEFDNEIRINSGGIASKIGILGSDIDADVYHPFFIIKTKALYNQLPKTMDLITEMINRSKLKNRDRIKQILLELKVDLESSILRASHTIAKSELYSYFSPGQYLRNKQGIPFYNFIKKLLNDFDNNIETIYNAFERILPKLTSRKNLKVLITAEADAKMSVDIHLQKFYLNLNNNLYADSSFKFENSLKNEGLITSTTVQYVFKGANFNKLGYKYTGAMKVLDTVLRYEYLWTNVRVLGGAYGAFVDLARNGLMSFGSYRDPNLENTINIYNNAYKFIENIQLTPREMTKYIIGTISKADMPISKATEGQVAFLRAINNVDQSFYQKERDEILNTTSEDLQQLAQVIKTCMDYNALCVIGSEKNINDCKNLFKQIKNIL